MTRTPPEQTHYFDHIYLPEAHDRNAKRTQIVIALTFVTMVIEVVAGWLTGSMSLLADGFHMATHVGALAIAAMAYRYARQHASDARFTFGTGKVGDLAGFASAILLGLASLAIAVESAERLFSPHQVRFGEAALIAVLGLVVNLVSALLLAEGHGHSHGHNHGHDHGGGHSHGHNHGHNHGDGHNHGNGHSHNAPHYADDDEATQARQETVRKDNNLRAAYLHVLADALTSVAAIVALLAGRYLGWVWLDSVIGIVGALIIARWSLGLMKDTASILLDTAEPELSAAIKDVAEEKGATVADLHVWRVGPHAHAVIVSMTGAGGDVGMIRQEISGMKSVVHVTVERLSV